MCHSAHNARKIVHWYAGNQLQQNSSGISQKAIMGAMISRHQAGVDNQVTGSMRSPTHRLGSGLRLTDPWEVSEVPYTQTEVWAETDRPLGRSQRSPYTQTEVWAETDRPLGRSQRSPYTQTEVWAETHRPLGRSQRSPYTPTGVWAETDRPLGRSQRSPYTQTEVWAETDRPLGGLRGPLTHRLSSGLRLTDPWEVSEVPYTQTEVWAETDRPLGGLRGPLHTD